MNIIAFDIASEVSSVFAARESGKMIFSGNIETTALAIKEVITRVPKPRCVVFEECAQASWLWSVTEPLCDDVIVCDPRQNRDLSGYKKSDKVDAEKLCERARLGALKRVWHGGDYIQSLRQAVFLYEELTRQSTRLKNQIKSVYRARGIRANKTVFEKSSRLEMNKQLPEGATQERVLSLESVFDTITTERDKALKNMVSLARQHNRYKALRSIDGIGPIFTSYIIAIVGDPSRFRTRRQFWAYVGLAVRTEETGQFTVTASGRIARKDRAPMTRGLAKSYNRTLKYVFKQVAISLSRTRWSGHYATLVERSRNANNAQLTIARKIAAVTLCVFKTGDMYNVEKAFSKKQ